MRPSHGHSDLANASAGVAGVGSTAVSRFTGAGLTGLATLLALQGLAGLGGSLLLARQIGRIGADRGARLALMLVIGGLALWCLATLSGLGVVGVALAMTVWGAGSFAFVSAQQARLATTAPELASASIALNSAGLYLGQAFGAALGGLLVAGFGYAALGPVALAVAAAAILTSRRADHAHPRRPNP